MPYVIQNKRTGTYIQTETGAKLKCFWRMNIEDATVFKTPGSAQNFILRNYTPFAKKNRAAPAVEELEVVPLQTQQEKEPKIAVPMRHISEYLYNVVRVSEMKKQIKDLSAVYTSMLDYAQQEEKDILHKIELDDHLNAAQRATLFKRLREVLIHRRKCIDVCRYLTQYENSGFLEACEKLEKMNQDFVRNLESRKYVPRVLTELFQKGGGIIA